MNRLIRILKNKTGASLVFVVGVMLLLLAVGVSALTAASSNAGFAQRQRQFNQVRILADSVHQNILFSLQSDPSDEGLLY